MSIKCQDKMHRLTRHNPSNNPRNTVYYSPDYTSTDKTYNRIHDKKKDGLITVTKGQCYS